MPRTWNEPITRRRLALVTVMLYLTVLGGCTAILGLTAGKKGIEQDPSERTFGTYVDDEMIESVAYVNLRRAASGLEKAHLEINSYNGIVLLTGQVGNTELKRIAAETVSHVKHVRKVHNELAVAPPTSFLARSNDSWLGTKVKTRLVAGKKTPGRDIVVIAEDGVIYLMGLVTRTASGTAAEIVRNTGGVRKVVKMFEYID